MRGANGHKREAALPGCVASLQFTLKGDKKTRKHLQLPAAQVAAAAPLMSRQLGLDSHCLFNVVPALRKKNVKIKQSGDTEDRTAGWRRCVIPRSCFSAAAAWSPLKMRLVEIHSLAIAGSKAEWPVVHVC